MGLTPGGRLLLLGAAAALAPGAAAGQSTPTPNEWHVVTSRASAVVTDDDDGADVHVRYVVAGNGSELPTAAVDVGLLEFEGTSVTDFVVSGVSRPVVLWTTTGRQRAASFTLPMDSVGAEGVVVNMMYHVAGAVRGSGARRVVRIPILSGPVPVEALPGHFQVEVRAPQDWAISEPFPSGLRSGPDGVLEASLPVTPAMVGFRATTDGTWRLSFPRLVDLVTLTVLVVFSGFGWRHMRRIQS